MHVDDLADTLVCVWVIWCGSTDGGLKWVGVDVCCQLLHWDFLVRLGNFHRVVDFLPNIAVNFLWDNNTYINISSTYPLAWVITFLYINIYLNSFMLNDHKVWKVMIFVLPIFTIHISLLYTNTWNYGSMLVLSSKVIDNIINQPSVLQLWPNLLPQSSPWTA